MRFFSTILFALFAMVLPMAGVQKFFCKVDMRCVGAVEGCPAEVDGCCDLEDEGPEEQPDCFVFTQLIPDAEKALSPFVAAVSTGWVSLPVGGVGVVSVEYFPGVDGVPEDDGRLFLWQQRWLI